MSPTAKRIVTIDTDPWQVRELNGTVRFKRADAAQLKVTALDFNGSQTVHATTVYYVITR